MLKPFDPATLDFPNDVAVIDVPKLEERYGPYVSVFNNTDDQKLFCMIPRDVVLNRQLGHARVAVFTYLYSMSGFLTRRLNFSLKDIVVYLGRRWNHHFSRFQYIKDTLTAFADAGYVSFLPSEDDDGKNYYRVIFNREVKSTRVSGTMDYAVIYLDEIRRIKETIESEKTEKSRARDKFSDSLLFLAYLRLKIPFYEGPGNGEREDFRDQTEYIKWLDNNFDKCEVYDCFLDDVAAEILDESLVKRIYRARDILVSAKIIYATRIITKRYVKEGSFRDWFVTRQTLFMNREHRQSLYNNFVSFEGYDYIHHNLVSKLKRLKDVLGIRQEDIDAGLMVANYCYPDNEGIEIPKEQVNCCQLLTSYFNSRDAQIKQREAEDAKKAEDERLKTALDSTFQLYPASEEDHVFNDAPDFDDDAYEVVETEEDDPSPEKRPGPDPESDSDSNPYSDPEYYYEPPEEDYDAYDAYYEEQRMNEIPEDVLEEIRQNYYEEFGE